MSTPDAAAPRREVRDDRRLVEVLRAAAPVDVETVRILWSRSATVSQ